MTEVPTGPGTPDTNTRTAALPSLRVKPLQFEEIPGSRGPQHIARTKLAKYTIRFEITYWLHVESYQDDGSRPIIRSIGDFLQAIQAAQEHHFKEVSKLFEPEDAQRLRPSLQILEDACAVIPDESDILRLLKARGSHRHVDIASRISACLNPLRAAIKMFTPSKNEEDL